MPLVDTSCIIHLARIGELALLKKLFSTITVTPEIVEEMHAGVEGVSEFQEALGYWIFVEKQKDTRLINALSNAESISIADASLILLAREKKDFLISNDATLIQIAKIKGVECWWLTTCIIEAVRRKTISQKKAKEILFSLITAGMYLENKVYAHVLEEIERQEN